MTEHTDMIRLLVGWTPEEIQLLIQNKECPDHWTSNPVPSFALMEVIRDGIEKSEISYRRGLPPVFDALGLKQPAHLVNFLSKIKRYVTKARKTGDFIPLCQEMPGLTKSGHKVIGSACAAVGISPIFLTSDDMFDGTITNQIIVELQQYRAREGITWKTVSSKWWSKLFPNKEPPLLSTLSSNWDRLAKRKVFVSRTSTSEDTTTFLNTPYTLPVKEESVHRPLNSPDIVDTSDDNHTTAEDGGYNTSDDDAPIHYILRSHGDTVAMLHELLEVERLEKLSLQKALAKEKEDRQAAENDMLAAHNVSKKHARDKFKLKESFKKERSKYERQLRQATELSAKLEENVSALKTSNVMRRLKTANKNLENEKAKTEKLKLQVDALKEEISKLCEELAEKRRQTKNRTEQIRYQKLKRSQDQAVSEEENRHLRSQLKTLEKENDELRSNLDEIMGDRAISTFEDGQYTADIRVVCYELISRGVGSRHVADIIRLVLKRISGFDCGRLPKPTLIRLMAFEQALLSKESAKEAIHDSQNPVTLQMDGTTKKHVPYVAMLASTDSGTYGLGLVQVQTENAQILLDETISAIKQLLTIDNISEEEDKLNHLLLKMKNTMTDRCVVNKKFVELLEKYREETLPKVIKNWDSLSAVTKANLTRVNDMYCGKHLVLNLQEYAGAALHDWETVESGGGKIGREKHLMWSRGKESATLLAVRTVCEAFGPDANPQAGTPIEFNDHMERIGDKSRLVAYRGNRFNVPFVNASSVFYHHQHGHIEDVYNTLTSNKQKNQLSRSVMYDLKDNIILGGIRAMGMINSHITLPLMSMLDSQDISVIATNKYYTRLHECVESWMRDPTDLLTDAALMFDDFPPVRDDIHRALYEKVDDTVEFNTKQAISIVLHNLYVCICRQVEDHLPGGKYDKPSSDLINETTTCPKDNVAAERVFAGLDYLKRKSPNISALAMEGVLLWTMNKTASFLDECSPSKREKLVGEAVKSRKNVVKLYRDKIELIKKKRREDVEQRQKAKEAKERALVSETVTHTNNVLKTCGFICDNEAHVDQLIENKTEAQKRAALLCQIKYFKCVNRGVVKGSLFYITSGGKPLSSSDLKNNLVEIICQLKTGIQCPEEPESTSNGYCKDKSREELKEKLLAKLNRGRGTKRKCPFPAETIVGKRIKHTCLSPDGSSLEIYIGRVLRESSADDIEELMEAEYKSYFEKGYSFYTVVYDPPYDQLFTYPLKKEWDDNLLTLM